MALLWRGWSMAAVSRLKGSAPSLLMFRACFPSTQQQGNRGSRIPPKDNLKIGGGGKGESPVLREGPIFSQNS